MPGRAGSSRPEFSVALPQIQSQFALKILQFPNLAANLNEVVIQQIADLFTDVSATIPQLEKLSDLLQGEAKTLHLLEEVEADDIVGGVGPKVTRCPRC